MTRLLWGVVALTSVLQGWVAMAEENEHYYGLTLVLLFVVTEIGPILWGLDDTVMKHLAETSNIAGNLTTNKLKMSFYSTTYLMQLT